MVAEAVEPRGDRTHQAEVAVPRGEAEQVGGVVVDLQQHVDGPVHDFQDNPFLLVAGELAVLVDPAVDLVAEAAVRRGLDDCAVPAQFPYFDVAHAGEVGDDDPAGGPQETHLQPEGMAAHLRPPRTS